MNDADNTQGQALTTEQIAAGNSGPTQHDVRTEDGPARAGQTGYDDNEARFVTDDDDEAPFVAGDDDNAPIVAERTTPLSPTALSRTPAAAWQLAPNRGPACWRRANCRA